MFRIASLRKTQLIRPKVTLVVASLRTTFEGDQTFEFTELKLSKRMAYFLTVPQVFFHIIDESSPLFDITRNALSEASIELIVIFDAIEANTSNCVQVRHSYHAEDIVWDRRFESVMRYEDNRWVVDYTRFHNIVPQDEFFSINKVPPY